MKYIKNRAMIIFPQIKINGNTLHKKRDGTHPAHCVILPKQNTDKPCINHLTQSEYGKNIHKSLLLNRLISQRNASVDVVGRADDCDVWIMLDFPESTGER